MKVSEKSLYFSDPTSDAFYHENLLLFFLSGVLIAFCMFIILPLSCIEAHRATLCRSLGAHVLIDDNPKYAVECAEIGMRVLLFDYDNSYPWCKSDSAISHPLVTKVHNWQEVELQLLSWVPR